MKKIFSPCRQGYRRSWARHRAETKTDDFETAIRCVLEGALENPLSTTQAALETALDSWNPEAYDGVYPDLFERGFRAGVKAQDALEIIKGGL